MRVRWVVVGCLLALGAVAARAGFGTGVDAPTWLNAGLVAARPTAAHPAAAAVLVGGESPATCSGVLIGCSAVLTAAHCLCPPEGALCQDPDALDPAAVDVYFDHAGFFEVERIDVHPSYAFPVSDLAVLQLAAPVAGVTPVALKPDRVPRRAPGLVVGFGSAAAGGTTGIKRVGDVTFGRCPAVFRSPEFVCWSFSGGDADSCDGDSGGPVFMADRTLAAVVTGGTDPECGPGDVTFNASVPHHHRWIAQMAGRAVAAGEGCGELPPVDGPGAAVSDFSGVIGTAADVLHEFVVPADVRELRVGVRGSDDGETALHLFVGRSGPAGIEPYWCSDERGGAYAYCAVPNPGPGRWYAMIRPVGGSGPYQMVATALGGEGPTCGNDVVEIGEECDGADGAGCGGSCVACECLACDDDALTVGETELAPRLFLRGDIAGQRDRHADLDPIREGFTLSIDDGLSGLSVTIPAGDPGWHRSNVRQRRHVWRGRREGLRRVVLRPVGDRWRLKVVGRDVPGADAIGFRGLTIRIRMGDACLDERFL